MRNARSSLDWNSGTSDGQGNCGCGERLLLVLMKDESWAADSEQETETGELEDFEADWMQIHVQMSGYFCPKCQMLVSLSVNGLGVSENDRAKKEVRR